MRERKYVKFRVDMYADTKFKIIDMKPERDLIHYVWNRIVLLAGKVNLEGDLYFSKTIPYTIETLAIEFNRDATNVKSALELLRELEMIELSGGKVYRVKNFAKHQGIKVKENEISNSKDNLIANESIVKEKNSDVLLGDIPLKWGTKKATTRSKKQKDKILVVADKEGKIKDNSKCCLHDGVKPLREGQSSISEWSFGVGS